MAKLGYRFNHGRDSNLYFWCNKGGKEIDCLIDRSGIELIPVEIKAGRTIFMEYFKNIKYRNKLSGQVPERSFVVYGGDQDQQRTQGRIISFSFLDPVTELL
ncbi:DUF4143 domain-containing protein [Methanospirillum stamsii]|uniref:DUF4143 domain-containing protein n=1 Tax=Methanospirillum stamsii TaxID=1277351 RepID=UPI0015E8390C|nr:DUF4143 domain-containing protein [Methanospirillum stamsii]